MRKKFRKLFKSETIIDTNIIKDLRDLNILDLPHSIFSSVYISSNILKEELTQNEGQLLIDIGYKPTNIETNEGYERLFYLKNNHPSLSTCDKVIVAIASEKKFICCTNDKAARKACEKIGVETTGTLGIICSAYENEIISRDKFISIFNEYDFVTSSYLSPKVIDPIRQLYDIPVIKDLNSISNESKSV